MVVLDMKKIITCEKCKTRTVIELSESTIYGINKCSNCGVMVSFSMADTEDIKCSNCKYFYGFVECRRYPPQVTGKGESEFPTAKGHNWCQEHGVI